MLPILFGSLIFGIESSWVQSTFALSLDTWRMALIVYIFAASVLPVWLLLQPRDYLASYMLYFSVFIGGVGMIFGGASYEVKLPAFKGFVTASGDWLWPLLFITVACGAISGFHSLVASGTTSKQLKRETDAVPVGYGAMLLEGVVGVIALGTIMMSGEMLQGGPTVVYGNGLRASLLRCWVFLRALVLHLAYWLSTPLFLPRLIRLPVWRVISCRNLQA